MCSTLLPVAAVPLSLQPMPMMELTSEQMERIVSSDNFVSFVDRASRLVERALSGPSDILFDYMIGKGLENGYVYCSSHAEFLTGVAISLLGWVNYVAPLEKS